MENRIIQLFKERQGDILSIFCTAGFPSLDSTVPVLQQLEKSGVNLVEIGMPYSDPIADGETIQASSSLALDNGMSIKTLFEQLANIREKVSIPLVLMGYLNPIEQYGIEAFCDKCVEVGIDGLILPDLPIDLYIEQYKEIFESRNISNILLITPQTSDARIRMIDENTKGFIYLVSDNSITGKASGISSAQKAYFERIDTMQLKNSCLIGFGISNNESFHTACKHSKGAIIGSAFIRAIEKEGILEENIDTFVKMIRG